MQIKATITLKCKYLPLKTHVTEGLFSVSPVRRKFQSLKKNQAKMGATEVI